MFGIICAILVITVPCVYVVWAMVKETVEDFKSKED